MPKYQPNIPTGTVNLDQDYLNLQGNFQQLDIAYGVDHVPFSNTSGNPPTGQSGMHTVIHFLSNSTTASNPPNNYPIVPPTAVGLTGELFTTQSNDGYNTDEILWYQSGGGRLSQLTSNFVPVSSTNGYTYLPGGILFQWMTVANPVINVTYNFPRAFASSCYNISLTPIVNNNGTFRLYVKTGSVTTTGFQVQATAGGGLTGMYVTAIGK